MNKTIFLLKKPKHIRTLNIMKNILLSFVFKGIHIGISLLIVPMTLNYLNKERYGLWLTLSSIIGWFSLFDIGLGNGFRNKFAEALAAKDIPLAKMYVSTTFALLTIIIGIVLGIFALINPLLDWTAILHTTVESKKTLSLLALIVFTFFALQFIFKLTATVLLASQKSTFADLIALIGSLLSLIVVFCLMQIGEQSLLFFGTAVAACPVLALIIAYIVVFNGKYHQYRPALRYIDFKQSKGLMGLGFMFFIPQICSLIIFSTSNIIITQLFTLSEVTVYNIAFKYFSIVTFFFNIIITPFWSAYTEAYIKQDILWIKNMLRYLILCWIMVCLGVLFMVIVSRLAYRLWIGDSIYIPNELTIGIAIYVCVANWNNIFAQFNAGASKCFIQVGLSVFGGIVFFPLSIVLCKRFGLIGIPLAMGLSIFPGSFISPIQCSKLINGKARGIWNK